MKKIFWIRTGLLLIILIFAVLGGNFLYTGSESAAPLDMATDAVLLSDETILVQTFSPAHARVTSVSLALQPPDDAVSMQASSGNLTVALSDHTTGAQIYSNTVALDGVPDCWYIDFPVNRRLDPNAQYDISIYAENYQKGKNPSLYFVPQASRIPEITESLTEIPRYADAGGAQSDSSSDTDKAHGSSSDADGVQSDSSSDTGGTLSGSSSDADKAHGGLAGAAAIRLTYDVLVPFRMAGFLTVLAVILLCTAAIAFFSFRKKKAERSSEDITLGKFLAVRIHRIPLIHILFLAAVTAAAVIVRMAFLPVRSNDYHIAYEVWINEIRSGGGLASLGSDIGDNPPLYMTLVTLTSYLPFEPIVIVKLPSIIFDFILAVICVKLSGQLGVTALHKKLTLYAVILLNPLTLLDSAAWGQCDSLYSSFILLTLLAICSAKLWSPEAPGGKKHLFWKSGDGICLLFAVAISLKLQAIFFLPVLCLLWITQKRNVLKPVQLLWVPIVYTVSCIPMYLAGRSLKVMYKIYLGQANRNYGTLTLNYPNLYSLIGTWSEELYDSYFMYGMLLTFLLLITLFYRLYCRRADLDSLTLCKVAALSILTICFCLPLVHERYAYVAEMLLFIIMVKEAKYIKMALITMLCTLFTYCSYLMQLEQSFSVLPDQVIALIRLGVICCLAGDIFQKKKRSKNGQ